MRSEITKPYGPIAKKDSATSTARRLNDGGPCCGKRLRAENQLPTKEDSFVAEPTRIQESAQSRHGDELGPILQGILEKEYQGEPSTKVARSSPMVIPSEYDSDDEEILKINQRQDAPAAKSNAQHNEPEDSKPPARTRKEEVLLPMAASLREFIKPGATKLYGPRPEWCMRDQNVNPNFAGRHARSSSAVGQQVTYPVPAVGLPCPIGAGLMVAPHNVLLSEKMLDVFAIQPRSQVGFELPFCQPSSDNDGINVGEKNDDGNHFSDQRQHQSQIPLLSTFGRDFDTALHATIRETATEAALTLLKFGANVEAENAKGITPLILSAQKGNAVLVRELLRRGALASRASSNGTTAVLQAAHFGHMECLKLLFRAGGVSLIEMANFNHTTPLMRAAQEGHVPIVQMLLDRGASVNRRNRVQMTALMLASQRGHGRVCQVLVSKGAELDSMTAQRSTSLLLACKRGNRDVCRVLVSAGCELWVQDSRGRTAREVAQRRDMKDLVPLIDSNVQLDLMQRRQRVHRNYVLVYLWNLLQQERAMIPLYNGGEESIVSQASRQVTIHQMMQELQNSKKWSPTVPSQCLSSKSTQALLRTMGLPFPLVELIAKFMPMPPMWDRRLRMLTKRSVINADAAVTCALDLIDEVLEEGGFVEACDFAEVAPPTHFGSWRDWKVHCRRCRRGGPIQLPDDDTVRPVATTATVPKPKENPSVLEMRRQAGFLHILANRTPVLAHVLAHQPYNMPRPLIQQLIATSDIQSLVRRMGWRGVHFEATVAMDLIMLVSRLCSWYSREREDKPYPIYPAVVHPSLPQPRKRPLPLSVPLLIVNAPFQYDPYPLQQPKHREPSGVSERPSAPGPT